MPHQSPGLRPLTERQEIFCRHVARGASAAAAARSAGYAPGNAAQQGSNLLQQNHVRVRIEDLRMRREGNRKICIAEMVDTLRLLMRRAIKAGDHRAAIRCIEVEARLCGLFPDRHSHEFVGADPLLDSIDGRPAALIPDRLFDEVDEAEEQPAAPEPTPMNPEETPFFPMVSDPDRHASARPAHPGGDAVEAASGSPGPAMTQEATFEEETAAGFVEPGFLEPGQIEPGHDAEDFAPDFDPVEARARRVARMQEAEDGRVIAQCPPRATSPAAPRDARSESAPVRALYAHHYGWDNAWADTPWTPPDWLPGVEVRDSRLSVVPGRR